MSALTESSAYRRLIAGTAVAGLLALTACGNGDDDGGNGDEGEAQDFGSIDVPLSWLHTAEYAGLYLAIDNGYYEEAGFDDVNLIPGGPSATPSTIQVATGGGLVGWSNPLLTASAIHEEGDDAPLKIIGAVFQEIPYTIVTMSDNPATTPSDLVGMSIGVPPANEPVFNAFLEANGLTQDDVDMISIQSDVQPFISGEVDAYLGFATNELISIEMAGYDVESLMFFDHGIASAGPALIATEDAIEENREAIKAFLEASIRGWQDSLGDHEASAETTVENHAADQNLDLEHQRLTSEMQYELITNDWTQENGLFTMSDEAMADTLEAIDLVGYDVPDDLFDMSLLEEIYEENPDLIGHP